MKTDHYMWKLYHEEQDSAKLQDELEALQVELEAKSELAAGVEAQIKEKRQAQAALSKQRLLLEKKVAKMREECDKQVPERAPQAFLV